LDRLCAERGIPLVQAMAHGQDVWVGPAGRVGVDGPGACDGWRRLAALGGAASSTPAGGGAAASTRLAPGEDKLLRQELCRLGRTTFCASSGCGTSGGGSRRPRGRR